MNLAPGHRREGGSDVDDDPARSHHDPHLAGRHPRWRHRSGAGDRRCPGPHLESLDPRRGRGRARRRVPVRLARAGAGVRRRSDPRAPAPRPARGAGRASDVGHARALGARPKARGRPRRREGGGVMDPTRIEAFAEAPRTPEEVAAATGTEPRLVREWLASQRAAGYVGFDAASGRFALPPEHAFVLAQPDSPAFLTPAFDVTSAIWRAEDRLLESFRTGSGVGWREHDCRL